MAAVAPPADQTKELLQKLSLEPKNKTNDAPEATKKNSGAQQTTANGAETMNNSIVPLDRSLTPILKEYADGNMCYLPNGYPSSTYYYGGYDVMLSEWEDYARYVNPEGVEMFPGFYEDMYRHPYGYASYGPYPSPGSPVPTMGHDGQLHGPQHYQFSAPYYQTSNPTSTPFINQTPSSKGGILTSLTADQPPVSVDSTKSNANTATKTNSDGNNVSTKPKQSQHSLSSISNGTFDRGALPGGLPSSGYQDPRFGFEGMWTTVPWFDGHMFPDVPQRPASLNSVSSTVGRVNNSTTRRNQNLRPLSRIMGSHAPIPTSGMGMTSTGIMNNIHGNNQMYGQNTNAFSGSFSFGSNALNVQWGIALDNKYKPRDHRGNAFYGFGNENLDGLSELNRGPRAGRFKNQKGVGQTVTLAVKGQPLPAVSSVHKSFVIADRDQYNKPDFPEAYLDAKFFVIKSYSEDDIHKSIKYNVWASTPNGNKKLDAAYHEASEKTVRCPVFLFFSVNTSGQFVGVAEMIGPVDFNKTVEYWQQDKWTGCFPVKWHIVKDVPNNVLKHITLENNDNKPVTNSRDTQEVNLEQGHQVLKLLKEHVNRTSILDDFSFYEVRQKVMQEKRTKQQYLQKKMNTLYTSEDPLISSLYALSIRPDSCLKRYNKLIYNGVRFHTIEFDRRKKTQNSGVLVEGNQGDSRLSIEFYGVLTDIYELTFIREKRVFIFKCKWWDTNEKHHNVRKVDGLKSIRVTRTWYEADPYVLASQAKQIYYLQDMKLGDEWRVVQQFQHRHLYNLSSINNNVTI